LETNLKENITENICTSYCAKEAKIHSYCLHEIKKAIMIGTTGKIN
jgi:hypothetical protein